MIFIIYSNFGETKLSPEKCGKRLLITNLGAFSIHLIFMDCHIAIYSHIYALQTIILN